MSEKLATKETVLKFASELNELLSKYGFFMTCEAEGIEVSQLHNGKIVGLFSEWEFPADTSHLEKTVFS